MSQQIVYPQTHQEDDLARYEERYTPEERDELRVASLAHDIVFLRDRARREYGPRAVVTIAVPWYDLRVERLTAYLAALGERVRVTEQRLETGRYVQVAPIRRPSGEAVQKATA
jgi:hypothetical protein